MKTLRSLPALAGLALATAALATAPALAETFRGDLDRPPFYDGRRPAVARRVAHVSVGFHSEPASLDPTPDRSPALAALLDSLRAGIDRLALTRPLAGGDWPMRDAPRVRFGCKRGGTGPDGIPRSPEEIGEAAAPRMAFGVEGPGRAWRERVRAGAGDSVDAVVVVNLTFGEQWVRQVSWKGAKAIELGTGRTMPVAWLTSLDSPVQVLQLTGALVTPAGKILRVGSEGLLARRTRFGTSVLGAQEVLGEDELAAVTTPAGDGPAPWRTALRALVDGLLEGRPAN